MSFNIKNKKKKYKALILGRPNSGKSLLFNFLSGKKNRISNNKFETRDFIQSNIGNVELIDSPGIFFGARTEREKNTIKIMESFLDQSEILILVIDNRMGLSAYDKKAIAIGLNNKKPLLIVENDRNNLEDEMIQKRSSGFPIFVLKKWNRNSCNYLKKEITKLINLAFQIVPQNLLNDAISFSSEITKIKQIGPYNFKIKFRKHLLAKDLKQLKKKISMNCYNELPIVSIQD